MDLLGSTLRTTDSAAIGYWIAQWSDFSNRISERPDGCPKTAEHCGRFAAEARRIALLAGTDRRKWKLEPVADGSVGTIPLPNVPRSRATWASRFSPEDQFPMIIDRVIGCAGVGMSSAYTTRLC